MNLTRIIILPITILISQLVSAQKNKTEEYFVTKDDTVFCKDMSYGTTAQGFLNELKYTDLNGNKVELKGRKNVPDVLTFYKFGSIIDKTPLKANKPDSYIRYTDRAVNGKLKVYLAQQGYLAGGMTYNPSVYTASSGGWQSTGGPSGIYRFYIKMPDGSYYKINSKKNMKNIIKPYLLSCKEFENNYKGDFSTREQPFMDMIKLYNSLCK